MKEKDKVRIYGETSVGIPFWVCSSTPTVTMDESKAVAFSRKVAERIKKHLEKVGDTITIKPITNEQD